jgi:hypothetical protein
MDHHMPTTRYRGLAASLLAGALLLAGCTSIDVTNPNSPTSDNFWKTSADAQAGLTATYRGLNENGAYGRWLVFATDLRADDGRIQSPWTDLQNFASFTFVSYDFEVNRELWQHPYQAIFRANQVIANVPKISMDATARDRIVGEAKFIRALMYYNLVTMYGNIPLITDPPTPTSRPASVPPATTYAQIEKDLTDAIAVLPEGTMATSNGRATKGSAQGLLGRAQLQERKWAAAAATLQPLATGTTYSLMPNYADNFTQAGNNNNESLFEVQFADEEQLSQGVRGLNITKMVGPCGPSYCDGRPTQFLFNEFQQETDTLGQVDPRLDATIFYNKPGGMNVYGRSFISRYGATSTAIYFKKWGEYYLNEDQDWDAPIDFRVIRFSDVLLMYAEALNETGQTAAAYPFIDRVRQRAGLAKLSVAKPGLTTATMREQILHERLTELALEGSRFNDLARHDKFTTDLATLKAHDPEFNFFKPGYEYLPIPQSEIDLNPNVKQNPGWGG